MGGACKGVRGDDSCIWGNMVGLEGITMGLRGSWGNVVGFWGAMVQFGRGYRFESIMGGLGGGSQ